jgi:tRNA-2-methylthio-N6-dimethylallyladenosine synthase
VKLNSPKTFYIKTFGCQANEVDSSRIADFLIGVGLSKAKDYQLSDLVIINSCAVRQSAEDRVIGLVYKLSQLKKRPVIIVSGCLLYHNKAYLRQKFADKVGFFVKTGSWPKFISQHWPLAKIKIDKPHLVDQLAYIPIMEGCNNFCTYCVVPYARGREKSYLPLTIFCLVNRAIKNGASQILLLGQNVNSYGKDLPVSELKSLTNTCYQTPFASLLKKLAGFEAIEKISFLTSNPQDLNEEIIEALSLEKIDNQLHLPVQSGDDEILRAMNRRYTSLQYIELIKKIKAVNPKIKVSTDIIVGFSGETEEQFNNTVKLCRQVGFNKAYINKYSPRPGTAAEHLVDNVSWQEKRRRWEILNRLINN